MSRGVKNWTHKKTIQFLKENGFQLNHTRGSHFYFTGYINKAFRQVCVPFHGKGAIKPRTMNGIIKQSGIAKEIWFK